MKIQIKKITRVLDHIGMIIAAMFVVFFFIDRVNTAMGFMSSSLSKWLILVLCLLVIARSAISIFGTKGSPRRTEVQSHKFER